MEKNNIAKPYNKKLHQQIKFSLLIAFLALFFTAIGIAAGYKNWLRIHDKAKLALQRLDQLEKDHSAQKQFKQLLSLQKKMQSDNKKNKQLFITALAEIHQLKQQSDSSIHYLEAQIKSITQQQYKLKPSIEQPLNNLKYNNIQYLLQLANSKQQLGADNKQILFIFQQIKLLLIQLSDPNLTLLRQKINQHIATLYQQPSTDLSVLLADLAKIDRVLIPLAYVNDAPSHYTKKNNLFIIDNIKNDSFENTIKAYLNTKIIKKPHIVEVDFLSQLEQQKIYQLLLFRFQLLHLSLVQKQSVYTPYLIDNIKYILEYYFLKKSFANNTLMNNKLPIKIVNKWINTLVKLKYYNEKKSIIDIKSLLVLFNTVNEQ